MKISTKQLLFFLPLAVLFALGMSLLSRHVVLGVIEQEVTKRGLAAVSATLQKPELVQGVRARDEGRLLGLLQPMVADGQGIYAMVQDLSGRVIAHTNVAERGKLYEDAITRESLDTEQPVHRQTQTPDGTVLNVMLPIWDAAQSRSDEAFLLLGEADSGVRKRLGTLRLGVSMQESLNTADRISKQVSLVIALGCTLFIGLALFFNRRILKPIGLLAEATDQVRQGKLGKTVPVLSQDEIGDLAKSFNRMSRDLAETTVSKAYTDNILRSMNDALIVVSPEGTIEAVNAAACDLLDYQERELIGRAYGSVLKPGDGDGETNGVTAVLARGQAVRNAEQIYMGRKEREIPVLLSGAVMRNDADEITGFVYAARDISEQKKAEETRRQMERQLLQSERMAAVGTVAAGIVHNLKNPLTGILGFAELLKMKHPDLNEADRILTSAELMNTMIENILAKSRQKRNLEALDLNRLIDRELDFLMADRAFKRDVVKQVELALSLPSVQGVYTDFSQVFGNLLRNAVEAMHKRPQKILRVETVQESDFVVARISDTGCGISERNLANLFNPFFTTKTDAEGPQGTGLGLYTAKRLLETYRATISVDSEVDRGTTFCVRIPIKRLAGEEKASG